MSVDAGTAMAVAVRDAEHRNDSDSGRRLAVSLLDATLESTSDGIVVVSSEGQITGINDQYLKLWGMPPELIAAEDPDALVAVHRGPAGGSRTTSCRRLRRSTRTA